MKSTKIEANRGEFKAELGHSRWPQVNSHDHNLSFWLNTNKTQSQRHEFLVGLGIWASYSLKSTLMRYWCTTNTKNRDRGPFRLSQGSTTCRGQDLIFGWFQNFGIQKFLRMAPKTRRVKNFTRGKTVNESKPDWLPCKKLSSQTSSRINSLTTCCCRWPVNHRENHPNPPLPLSSGGFFLFW